MVVTIMQSGLYKTGRGRHFGAVSYREKSHCCEKWPLRVIKCQMCLSMCPGVHQTQPPAAPEGGLIKSPIAYLKSHLIHEGQRCAVHREETRIRIQFQFPLVAKSPTRGVCASSVKQTLCVWFHFVSL